MKKTYKYGEIKVVGSRGALENLACAHSANILRNTKHKWSQVYEKKRSRLELNYPFGSWFRVKLV